MSASEVRSFYDKHSTRYKILGFLTCAYLKTLPEWLVQIRDVLASFCCLEMLASLLDFIVCQ